MHFHSLFKKRKYKKISGICKDVWDYLKPLSGHNDNNKIFIDIKLFRKGEDVEGRGVGNCGNISRLTVKIKHQFGRVCCCCTIGIFCKKICIVTSYKK